MKKITPFILTLCLSLGLNSLLASAETICTVSALSGINQITYTRFTADTKSDENKSDKNKSDENKSDENKSEKSKSDEKAEKTDSKAADETETEVPETELEPTLLDTDIVSTDEILMFSTAAVVMDADTGDVLYYKNPDQVLYPASLTKIMTTFIALENCSMDETVKVSETALDVPWDSTRLGVLEGQEITMEEALYAVMVTSANDIANAVAEHVSGSQEDFAAQMNKYATELGLENTHFTNANGLHNDEHYSTARELALICKEALTYDAFKDMASAKIYTYTSEILREEDDLEKIKKENDGKIPPYVLYSHHKMLNGVYEYEYATGGKTGYTPEARITLATFAEKDGKNLICVMLDCPGQNENVYKDYVYMDTEAALNYCFDNYDQIMADIQAIKASEASETSETIELESIEPSDINTADKPAKVPENTSNDASSKQPKINAFLAKISNFLDLSDSDKTTGEKAIVVGILVVCIILLMVIIRQLVKVLKRKHRRLKYKKLKKQRLAQDALETASAAEIKNNLSTEQPEISQ